MKLKRTNLISHISNLMGLVVLLSLVVFLIWAATLMRQATEAVKTAISVSDTYRQMQSSLAKEKALQYEYALHPSPAVHNEHLAAATTLSDLVQVLLQNSDTDDDRLARKVSIQQAS